MDTELTIQQVAQMTQLSGHTLRYYERIGKAISRESRCQRSSTLFKPRYSVD